MYARSQVQRFARMQFASRDAGDLGPRLQRVRGIVEVLRGQKGSTVDTQRTF